MLPILVRPEFFNRLINLLDQVETKTEIKLAIAQVLLEISKNLALRTFVH